MLNFAVLDNYIRASLFLYYALAAVATLTLLVSCAAISALTDYLRSLTRYTDAQAQALHKRTWSPDTKTVDPDNPFQQ